MATVCGCGDGAKNLSQSNCSGSAERPVKLGFVQRIANDGTKNKISVTDDLNDAFFTSWINNTDKSKRLFPSGVIKSVVDERGDPVTFEADGVEYFASEGNRTFTFEIIEGASPQLAGAYNSLRCKDMMVYNFSLASQIVGNGKDTGVLYGFRIEKDTLYAKFMPKTHESPAKLMITFTLSTLEDDSNRAFIEYNSTSSGAGILSVDVLDYDALVDVTMGDASGISTTGFTTLMTYIYGDHFSPNPFTGGLLADFTLYNESTEAAVVITSVTPTENSYAFVIPAQTSTDVLALTFQKDGFEATSTLSITIP